LFVPFWQSVPPRFPHVVAETLPPQQCWQSRDAGPTLPHAMFVPFWQSVPPIWPHDGASQAFPMQ
jgi:hypothetical protein